MTRVDAARDARHDVGRLLTVYGATSAEVYDELPQIRRAPQTTLIQNQLNNKDGTRSSTTQPRLQYLRSAIGSTTALVTKSDDKTTMKYNNVLNYTKYLTKEAADKLEYRYLMLGRKDKMLPMKPEMIEYVLRETNKINGENTFEYGFWNATTDHKQIYEYLNQLLKQKGATKEEKPEPLAKTE